MLYNQNITLDLTTNSSLPYVVVCAKQGDNGRTLTATILNNGQVYSIPPETVVSYRIRKPNGGGSWNDAEIVNNKVVITLTSADLSTSGRCLADILFTIGTERISTISFIIDVAAAPDIINPITQSETFDYLYRVIDQANYVIETAQAWAEGKRGTEEVLGDDSSSISITGSFTATMSDFNKFKQNIYPVNIGTIATYNFSYDNGWIYQYDQKLVDLDDFGITVSGTVNTGDWITVTATIADPAWHNNAKYYMDQSADVSYIEASISVINSNISAINSSIIALQSNAAAAGSSIIVLQSNITAAQSSIEALQSNLNTATNNIITLQSNAADISLTIGAMGSNISTLGDRVDDAAASIANNTQDIGNALSSISTLNTKVNTANSSIVALQTAVDTANSSISTIQSTLGNIGFYSHANWIAEANDSTRPSLTDPVTIPPGQYIIIGHAPVVNSNIVVQLNGTVQSDYWNIQGRDSFTFYRELDSNTSIYLRAASNANTQFSNYENNPHTGLDIIRIK